MKRFTFPLAAVLAFTLGACGGKTEPKTGDLASPQSAANPNSKSDSESDSKSKPIKIDACELFPADEASAIAGEQVSWMSSTLEDAVGRDPLNCSYNAGTTENPRILSLIVRPAPSPERAARMHKAARSSFETMVRGEIRDLPNLGESAFWAGGNIQQLRVLSGAHELAVTVNLGADKDGAAAAQKIAAQALERLLALTRAS